MVRAAVLTGSLWLLVAVGAAEGREPERSLPPGLIFEPMRSPLELAVRRQQGRQEEARERIDRARLRETVYRWVPAARRLSVDGDALMLIPGDDDAPGLRPYLGLGRSEAMEEIRENENRAFVGARVKGERSQWAVEVDETSEGFGAALTFSLRY